MKGNHIDKTVSVGALRLQMAVVPRVAQSREAVRVAETDQHQAVSLEERRAQLLQLQVETRSQRLW
jgi:hypothetical protein